MVRISKKFLNIKLIQGHYKTLLVDFFAKKVPLQLHMFLIYFHSE